MELSPRIAEQVNRLPAILKQLLDAEIALGNEIYSMELGRGSDQGKVALILNHPFRSKPDAAPAGVKYREFLDRDPRIYEFYLPDDDRFVLMTAKFKPMKFEPIVGPPNPTQAHIEFMEKRAKEEEEKAKKRLETDAEEQKRMLSQAGKTPKIKKSSTGRRIPSDPVVPANLSEASRRFLASMTITFDMWHDGLGYDLEMIAQIPINERDTIEQILRSHQPQDWRDIEALAEFDTPTAKQAIVDALKSSDSSIRREARNHIDESTPDPDREKLLIKSLKKDEFYGGLTEAIDDAADFHPPGVIEALLHGCIHRGGDAATHFAALLYYIHGKAKEPFDWDHRPFYLRFNTEDRAERKAALKELCETIGVDGKKYLR